MTLYRFGVVLPLFVNYFCEIPSLGSANILSISSKSMFYLMGAQVAFSSTQHSIVSAASVLAGLWIKNNILWVKQWIRVPIFFSSVTDR